MASINFKSFVTGLSIVTLATIVALTGCDGIDAANLANPVANNAGDPSKANALQPDSDGLDDQDNATDLADANTGNDGAPQGDDAAPADAVTAALADRFFTFGSSSFFSSGSITDSDELQLCAFGRFGMRITRITSTSFDTFSSEDLLVGNWSIVIDGGAAVLVLDVDNASDPADIGTRQIAVAFDAAGNAIFDGAKSEAVDAAADCASAQ